MVFNVKWSFNPITQPFSRTHALTKIAESNISAKLRKLCKTCQFKTRKSFFIQQNNEYVTTGGGGGGGGGGKGGKHNNNSKILTEEFFNWFPSTFLLIIFLAHSPISKAEQEKNDETVAIIVPVLNEIQCVKDILEILAKLDPVPDKIIVVDGGSTDGTLEILKQNQKMIEVIQSDRGRGLQQNVGAAIANTDYVCFLHADTIPPVDLVAVIRRVFKHNRRVVAGGFKVSIEVPQKKLHFTSFHNNIKSFLYPIIFRPLSFIRGIRLLFGDQAIFVRNKEFQDVGGFDVNLELMEEADLMVRMHNQGPLNMKGRGKIYFVGDREVVTSGRRIYQLGEVKAFFIHMLIGLSWYLGADANSLQNLKKNLYQDSFR